MINSGLQAKMRVVIAPIEFKEWKPPVEIAAIMRDAIIDYCKTKGVPEPQFDMVPIGDGGKGTIDAIITARPGDSKLITAESADPLGNPIESSYLSLAGEPKIAFIEMARSSGLDLVPLHLRNPLLTTSYGVGELVAHAHYTGHRRIIIGVGGAGSHDGGSGMAQALGVQFFDRNHHVINGVNGYMNNQALEQLKVWEWRLDGLAKAIVDDKSFKVEVATDVDNLLLGTEGASYVFGPQKGASPQEVLVLEKNLEHLADVCEWLLRERNEHAYLDKLRAHGITSLDRNFRDIPQTGAAGGLPYGVLAFLDGYVKKGMIIVSELLDLKGHMKEADLVITGEGRLDETTFRGKGVMGVGEIARSVAYKQKRAELPVIAVCGSTLAYNEANARKYVDTVYPASPKPIGMDEVRARGKEYLVSAVKRAFDDFINRRIRK